MQDELFRILTASEEITFRQWARDNFVPDIEVKDIWHPIVRDELTKLQADYCIGTNRMNVRSQK